MTNDPIKMFDLPGNLRFEVRPSKGSNLDAVALSELSGFLAKSGLIAQLQELAQFLDRSGLTLPTLVLQVGGLQLTLVSSRPVIKGFRSRVKIMARTLWWALGH